MAKPTRPPSAQPGHALALSAAVRQKITEWLTLRQSLQQGKETEMALRKELAALFVPNPVEGTNTVEGEGFMVKLVQKINRKLDVTTLDAIMPQMPEDARVLGTLIRYVPTFSTEYYRQLTPEARKTFEQTLEISEGSPELEIILAEENTAGTAIAGYGTRGKLEAEAEAKRVLYGTPEFLKRNKTPNPTSARTTSKKSAPNTKTRATPSLKKPASKKSKRGKK